MWVTLHFFMIPFFSPRSGARSPALSGSPVHFAYGGMRQVPPTGVSLTPALIPVPVLPATRSRSWLAHPPPLFKPFTRMNMFIALRGGHLMQKGQRRRKGAKARATSGTWLSLSRRRSYVLEPIGYII